MSDSEQLFDLVVLGHHSSKPVEALVKDILNLLDDDSTYLEFKLSDALLFNNGMVSIRDGISFEEAQEIRHKLASLEVDCDIRPTLQLIPINQEEAGAETSRTPARLAVTSRPKSSSRMVAWKPVKFVASLVNVIRNSKNSNKSSNRSARIRTMTVPSVFAKSWNVPNRKRKPCYVKKPAVVWEWLKNLITSASRLLR